MKFRIDRVSAESTLLPWLLEEPKLDPQLRYNLAVDDAEGFCGWAGIDRLEDADSGRFGWYLHSDRWGRGYGTEATGLLLAFGFSALGRSTKWATADPENLASIRVLEKPRPYQPRPDRTRWTWRGERPRVLFTMEADRWEVLARLR